MLDLFTARILPFDAAAARRYAELAVKARAAGKGFPTSDGYIAAIAAAHAFAVASRDTGCVQCWRSDDNQSLDRDQLIGVRTLRLRIERRIGPAPHRDPHSLIFSPARYPLEHQEIIGDHDGDLLGRPAGPLFWHCALGVHDCFPCPGEKSTRPRQIHKT